MKNHAALGLASLLALSFAASAQTVPPLGTTATYGIVSSTFTNSNTAPQTIINGDVCFTTGPVTPPLSIIGATVTPCPPAVGTRPGRPRWRTSSDRRARSSAPGRSRWTRWSSAPIPPGTIPPGCYSSGGAMNITATTNVTLSGAGVYIFRPGGALNTGANSRVLLAGGACSANVFWAPVGAATIGASAALSPTPTFVGNILSAAGITIGHFAHLTGRALAFGGTVTTDANTITQPTCAALPAGAREHPHAFRVGDDPAFRAPGRRRHGRDAQAVEVASPPGAMRSPGRGPGVALDPP